ncbi:hypothetical protein Rs2_24850 [Raphanus sativus]|nr:hypothetical protein Rs2_24850 [Raphanus sativus]
METDGDVFYLIQLSLIITRPWTASLSFRMAALYAAENILCGIMIISISAAQTAVRSSTAVFMNVQVGLHIQHPLTLFYRDDKTGNISNIVLDDNSCKLDINHQESDTTDDQGKYKLVHIVPSKSDIIFDKCTWCGKDFEELEWEPEEAEDTEEDIAPFKKLGDGFIKHFGHEQHPLKLKKHDGVVVDIEKLCEACVCSIVSDQFYDCEECILVPSSVSYIKVDMSKSSAAVVTLENVANLCTGPVYYEGYDDSWETEFSVPICSWECLRVMEDGS